MFNNGPNQRKFDIEIRSIPTTSLHESLDSPLINKREQLEQIVPLEDKEFEVIEAPASQQLGSENYRKLNNIEKAIVDGTGFLIGSHFTATIMGCSMLQVLSGALVTRIIGSELEKFCFKSINYFTGQNFLTDSKEASNRVNHPVSMASGMLCLAAAGAAESMAFIFMTEFAIPAFQMGRLGIVASAMCGSLLALGMSRMIRDIAWRPYKERT